MKQHLRCSETLTQTPTLPNLHLNSSPKLAGEGVQRNALRVQRPKSPHSKEIAQT